MAEFLKLTVFVIYLKRIEMICLFTSLLFVLNKYITNNFHFLCFQFVYNLNVSRMAVPEYGGGFGFFFVK